jgi:hypothetical protein
MTEAAKLGEPLEPLLSLSTARQLLGISQASLYRLLARGELEVVEVAGRRLIEPATLRTFISERRRTRSSFQRGIA